MWTKPGSQHLLQMKRRAKLSFTSWTDRWVCMRNADFCLACIQIYTYLWIYIHRYRYICLYLYTHITLHDHIINACFFLRASFLCFYQWRKHFMMWIEKTSLSGFQIQCQNTTFQSSTWQTRGLWLGCVKLTNFSGSEDSRQENCSAHTFSGKIR